VTNEDGTFKNLLTKQCIVRGAHDC
jgi:hypothetical protein